MAKAKVGRGTGRKQPSVRKPEREPDSEAELIDDSDLDVEDAEPEEDDLDSAEEDDVDDEPGAEIDARASDEAQPPAGAALPTRFSGATLTLRKASREGCTIGLEIQLGRDQEPPEDEQDIALDEDEQDIASDESDMDEDEQDIASDEDDIGEDDRRITEEEEEEDTEDEEQDVGPDEPAIGGDAGGAIRAAKGKRAAQRLSKQGAAFIAKFEGVRRKLYNDPAGHCTIGVGHLVHKGACNGSEPAEFKRGISRQRAFALLQKDAKRMEKAVRSLGVPLNQHQFDALVSFTYNLGPAWVTQNNGLRRALRARRYRDVPRELNKWVLAGGKRLPGLVRRRKAEGRLFAKAAKPSKPSKPGKKPVVRLADVQPGKKNSSVLVVQKALARAVGLDYSSGAGTFGPRTKAAYAKWQRRLGFSGRAADGKPGIKTLKQLGDKYGFIVKGAAKPPAGKKPGGRRVASPVPGHKVTYPFGRRSKRYAAGYHTGDDYAAPVGTPVVAVRDGKIVLSKANDPNYGNWIGLEADNGRTYYYAHLSARLVKVGQKVKAGQKIGKVGQTGKVTGPHLHFEDHPRGPYNYRKHRKPAW
jgi:murein DD-endopeptidase MepM/ murein hydrolase activator NlpD